MKKIILSFLFLGSVLNVFGQKTKIIELFDRYQNTEGITSIKIAKPMFSLLSQLDLQDAELETIQPMLGKIDGIRILILESSEGKAQSLSNLRQGLISSIQNLHYEELITVNSNDSKVRFLAADTKGDTLSDLLLSVSNGDNMVFMLLDGKISMEDVNNLATKSQSSLNSSLEQSETRSSNSSILTREVRRVEKFTGISASSGVKVSFTQSPEQKVTVSADGDKLQYVKTEVASGILRVFIESPNKKGISFKNLHVEVSAPNITDVNVAGGANFNGLNRVSGRNFDLKISSGARLSLDLDATDSVNLHASSGSNGALNVNTKSLDVKASSGVNVSLNGLATAAAYEVSSAATINAQDLKSEVVRVDVSSAGNLKINATKSVEGEVSSSGSVRYRSNPKPASQVTLKSAGSYKSF